VPGAHVAVVARAPFDGPVTVLRADDATAEPLALAHAMAASIQAEVVAGT
jgi:Fe2+ transport system protein FeoA